MHTVDRFWSEAVGQEAAIETLEHVTSPEGASDLAHAWLITGPPGSGRSNLAYRFAAALIARTPDEREEVYRQVRAHTHPDLEVLTTEGSIIKIDDARHVASRSNYAPTNGRFRVILAEDADRLPERTSNTILKELEEPPATTVWVLCAPSEADLLPTISSRARSLRLVTPTQEAVAQLLEERDNIAPDEAARAARLAQSHIGMAKKLATDAEARERREDTLRTVLAIGSLSDAMRAAGRLAKLAEADAQALTESRDEKEREELLRNLGLAPGAAIPMKLRAQFRELEDDQKRRAKRSVTDGIDRILTDIGSVLRDTALVALDAQQPLINEEFRTQIEALAASIGAEGVLYRLDRVAAAREQLLRNVSAALVLESLMASFLLEAPHHRKDRA
ncbi:DNA polymerase III subunit delta' [Leucobacter sp. UCMA 4100]|uniref:DNA polymerase III subunit delta' n=1 Tax=Leucobacter sp. UCMA 4100 TaxID=2810534 RepID=UPI0022EB5DDF|nr:DNA polymerase III subunit delta' [Leucobacter sp. UCMA 4100]MDA3146728.1 DNA polymerase III subunit delta' [Leucobacter sp. UCMA 4100]